MVRHIGQRAVVLLGMVLVALLATGTAAWASHDGPPPAATYPLEPYVLSDGSPVCDPAGQSPPQGDIVCDTAGNSIYVGSDGTTVTMAINLFEDPTIASQQAPFNQVAFTVLVAVDGVQVASFGIDGKKTGNGDVVYAKCTGSNTLTYHRTLSTALAEGDVSLAPVAVDPSDPAGPPGGVGSRLTFTVPISALATCGVLPSTPIGLMVGSSQAGNLDTLNKDVMLATDTIDFSQVGTIAFDGDLVLGKTATAVSGPTPPQTGQTTTYDLVVRARAISIYDLTGVVITDTLPADVTIVSTSASAGTVTRSGQTLDWALPLLEPARDQTLTIRVSITPTSANVGAPFLLNAGATGSATRAGDLQTVSGTSPAVSTATVVGSAVTIAKSASPSSVLAGGTVTYTITINSTGTLAADLTAVTDSLPSGFQFTAGSTGGTLGAGAPTVSGQTVTWSGPFTIPAGASRTLTFSATAGTAGGTFTNVATATGPGIGTVSTGPTAPVTVTPVTDLTISKSVTPSPVVAGGNATYTVTVRNLGPSAATNVVVTDAVPAGTSFVSAGAGCTQSGGTVTCTAASLASGASTSFTITVLVAPSTTASISNTASVSSATTDPATGNNTTTLVTPVVSRADLSISTSVTPSPVTAGTTATYTLTVSNAGPSTATSVVVTDAVPAGTSFVSAGAGCSFASGTVTCTAASLASGASTSFTITVLVAPGTTGSISNTASVSSATTDPATGNNTTTLVTTVATSADLSLSKSGPAAVTAGTNATYTLTVSNAGPSSATGVVVTDPLPSGTTFVSASPGCAVSAGTVTCDAGSLAPGASTAFTITVALAPGATGSVSNTASVDSDVADPDPSDDSATATSTVTTSADLSSTLVASPDPVVAGGQLTLTATIVNGGPSDATGATTTISYPAGTSVVSLPAGCTDDPATRTITCTAGTLAPGGSNSFAVVLDVDPSVTGSLTATATADSDVADPDPSDDSATATSTVTTSADLSSTLVASPDPVVAGEQLTLTATIVNGGPSDATGATTTISYPAGTSVASLPAGCTDDPATRTITCTAGTLAPGGSNSFAVVLDVDPSVTGSLTATATAASDAADPDPSDDTATATVGVVTRADLAVTKTGPATLTAGTTITWTITVTNTGPSDATSVVLTDTLPAGTTFRSVSGPCSHSGGTVTCTIGTLAPGASTTITLAADVAPGVLGGLTNTAAATSATTDPDPTDDAGSATTTVTASADLGLMLTDSPDPVTAGANQTLTATVTNAGPSDAADGTVTFTLDPDTTVVSLPASCTFDAAAGTVTCATGAIAAGDSTTIAIVVAVDPAATGSLTATAEVSSTTPDANAGNDTATATSAIDVENDLAITITDSPDPVVAGTSLALTATVSSTGPSDATGVTAVIAIPDGTTFVSAPGGCTYDATAREVTCLVGTLPAGSTTSRTIQVTVDADVPAGSTLSTTGTVGSDVPDPNPTNDTVTATTTVTASADVSVSVSDAPDPVVAGTDLTYTITVSNSGPSDATGVLVSDPLPAGTTFVSASGGCTFASGTVTCDAGTVAAGGSATFTVTVRTAPSVTGTITNGVSVTTSSADPVAANDTATTTTTVTTRADLTVTTTGSPDPVTAGTNVTWTVTVTNTGPSDATGVVVSDPLPTDLTFVSASTGCSYDATSRTVTCTRATLAAGASTSFTITTTVAPGVTGSVDNSVSVTATTADPDTSDNSATGVVAVTTSADLALTKTGPASATPGGQLTWTLTVTNTGPSTATSITVTDVLPAGATFVSASAGCSQSGGTVTCTRATLAPGSSASFTITVLLDPAATGSITNTATVAAATGDPDGTDDSASTTTSLIPSADVSVSVSDAPDPVVAGTDLTYTITVSNSGPSDATGVLVSDPLPAGTTFVSASGGCTFASGTVTCDAGTVAAGGSATFTVTVRTAPSVTGTITNGVSVSSSSADPVAANDTATTTTTVTTRADLAVTLTASPDPVTAGETLTYLVSVTNDGPSDAAPTTVTLTIPADATVVSLPPGCTVSGSTITCAVGALTAGDTATTSIVVAIDSSATGTLTATASATSATTDPDTSDNTATATTAVTTVADVRIAIVDGPDPTVPGGQLTYTVTATNDGPSDASAVTTVVALDPAVTFVSASAGCTYDAGAHEVTCLLGDVVAGDAASATVVTTVDATATSDVVAAATVSTTTTDPVVANDTATALTALAPEADVGVVLTAAPDPAAAGTDVTWTATLRNNGPSDAATTTVTVALPAEFTFVSADPGCVHDPATNTVTCDAGTLASGATTSFSIVATLDAAAPEGTVVTGSATAATGATDLVTSNDTATESVTVRVDNDLRLDVTATPEPVTAGEDLTYTLDLYNAGPSDATGVVVDLVLPDGVTFVSAPTGCTYDAATRTVTCDLGTVTADTSELRDVVVTIDSATTGSVTADASVTADVADTVPDDNTDSVTSTVVRSADLALSVTTSTAPVVAGEPLTYTLTLTNSGPSDATGVLVSDPLPAGVTFVSADPACTFDAATRVVSCDVGTLAAGDTATLDITVLTSPDLTGSLTNVLSVSGATPDPDTSDNSATSTVAVVTQADLAITATESADPVAAGTALTTTLEVTNAGPSTARDAAITYEVPAGTTLQSTSGGCTLVGTTVTCLLGDLAPGETGTVTVTVLVDSSTTGTLDTTAAVASTTTDPVGTNDTTTVSTTVVATADLSLSLADSPDPVIAGTTATWTATVTNDGPSDATDTTVTFALPAGVTDVNVPAGCAVSGTTVTCDVGTLAPGATIDIVVTATVDPAATGSLSTTASVTSAATDPAPASNTDTTTTAVGTRADLSTSLVATPSPVTAGETLTLTATVTNDGPSDATDAVLVVPIPAGTTLVSIPAGCTQSGATLTCALGTLAPGESGTVDVVLTVDPATVGTVDASVSAASSTPDGDATNDTATTSTVVEVSADVAVSVTDSPDPVTAGSSLTYGLTVTSTGPSDAIGVEATLTLPAGVTVTSLPANCTESGGVVTCVVGTLAPGATVTYGVVVAVATDVAGTLLADAAVTSTSPDPDATNDTGTASTTVLGSADLSVALADSPDPAVSGAPVTYTATVSNDGPSTAVDATVSFTLPAGVTVSTLPLGCTLAGGVVSCDLGDLAPGASVDVVLEVVTSPSRTGSLTLSATVDAATADPDSSDDTATATTTLVQRADLNTTIVGTPDPVTAGTTLTHVVTVTNDGPSNATGATVTIDLPAGVTFSGASAGCSYDAAGNQVTCSLGTIAPGETVTVEVDGLVAANASGPLDTTAAATSATTDPDLTDNAASTSTAVVASADLAASLTGSPDPVAAGTELTYTASVTNTGPSTSSATEVVLALPADVLFVSAEPGCTYDAVGHTVTCTIGELAPGTTATFEIVTLVPAIAPAGTTLAATLTAGSATPDPDASNDVDADTATVSLDNDVSITLTDTPDPVVAGTDLTLTATATNSGPSDATGVVVVFELTPDLVPGSLPTNCTLTGTTVTCDVGTLVSGASATIALTVAVDPAASGTAVTSATVTQDVADAVAANDTDSTLTTVRVESNLAMTFEADTDTVVAGETLGYTMTVTNTGPSTSGGVAISDPLPANVSFVAAPGCTHDPTTRVVSCPVGMLAPGGSATFDLTVLVDPDATGSVTNTVLASSTTIDPDPTDNQATVVTTVLAVSDLGLTGSDSPDPATAGETITHTFTLTNGGPSTADGTVLSGILPDGLTPRLLPAGCTFVTISRELSCNVGSLAPGETVSLTFVSDLAADLNGTVTFTMTAASASDDPDPSDNSVTLTTEVGTLADLTIAITDAPDPVVAGTSLTYTLTVGNQGPSTAVDPVVTFALPAGVAFVSASPGCTVAGGIVTCTRATLQPDAVWSSTVTVVVASDLTGTLDAGATVSGTTLDPDPSDDGATTTTTITTRADLAASLLDSPDPAVAGEQLTYTVGATNTGPSTARDVQAVLALPDDVVFVSAPAGCTYLPATHEVVCDLGDVPAGGTATAAVVVEVSPSHTGSLTAISSVTSTTTDPDATDNTATAVTSIRSAADLTVTATASPEPVAAGQDLTYLLTVTNGGPSDATGVTATLALAPGTTFVSAPTGCTYDATTRTVTCLLGTLATGDSTDLAIVAAVDATTTGTVTATAGVAAATPDPDASGDTRAIDSTVTVAADLAASGRITSGPVVAGEDISYLLTATNAGPSEATDVTLVAVLPAGVTVTSVSAGCTVDVATNTVTCTVGDLAPGESVSVSVQGTVDPATDGVLDAAVTVDGSSADPDATNDSAVVSAPVATSADLVLSLSDTPDPVVAGTSMTYSAAVTNVGPSSADDVAVTFTLPADVAFVSAPAGCTYDAGTHTVTCVVGTLAADATATFDIVVEVPASTTPGSILELTAAATSSDPDPDAGNSTATATTTVRTDNDLVLAIADAPDPVVAGTSMTTTLTLENTGPSDATGVTITQELAAGTTFDPTTSDPACDAVGSTVTCSVGTLAAGDTVTFIVGVLVAPDTTGSVSTTATVTADVADSVAANNTATARTTVITRADLGVTLVASSDPAIAGTELTYTVEITNAGPSTATGVATTDPLPSNVTFVSATGGCTYDAATRTVSCPVADMDPDAVASFEITVLLAPSATGTVANTVEVGATTTDPDLSDNSATSVVAVVSEADLGVSLALSPSPAVAGEDVVVTATVTNAGPSTATGVTVTVVLDPDQVVTALPAGCTVVGSTLTCTVATLKPGQSATFVIETALDPTATGTITATAEVSSAVDDPDATDDTATSTATVEQRSDLVLTLTDTPDPVVAGEAITWTATITNLGPSTATGGTVTFEVPAGVVLDPLPAGCTLAGRTVTCVVGDLAPGESVALGITGTVAPDVTAPLSLTATVAGDQPDPDPSTNTVTSVSTVGSSADLSVVATGDPAPIVVVTENLTYTVTVSNDGPSTARDVRLIDALPVGVTFVSAPGCTYDAATRVVTCSVASLDPGATATFELTVNVDAATTGFILNGVSVSSLTDDPDASNDTAVVTTEVGTRSDLTIDLVAAPSPIVPGTSTTWTATVTNLGPSAARDTVVTFTLPADVAVTTLDPRCTLDTSTGVVTCDLGDLPSGSAIDLQVTGVVDAGVTTPVSVTATAGSATDDPDPASNSETLASPVAPSADLSVTVTGPTGPVSPGGTAVVTIDVASLGPSDATGVVVRTDPLPAGLRPVALPAGCTFDPATRVVTCRIGDLAAGATVSLDITLAVSDTATGDLAVTAGATSDVADPDAASNRDTATLAVAGRRVEVTIVASPDPVVAGEPIRWTTTVTNPGPGTLTDVVLQVVLPAGVTFVDGSDGCAYDAASRTLTCMLGDLAAGESVQVLADALVGADTVGALAATATVRSTTGDSATAAATATTTTTTTTMAMADLRLTVDASVDGRTVTYTAVVTNAGPSVVVDGVVTWTLPDGVTVASLPTGCTLAGNVISCAVGTLGVGASVELVLVLVAGDAFDGPLALVVEVGSASAADPDTADNRVEVVVSMEALPAAGADADQLALLALLLLLAGLGLLRRTARDPQA